jgi:hypothetical protein
MRGDFGNKILERKKYHSPKKEMQNNKNLPSDAHEGNKFSNNSFVDA